MCQRLSIMPKTKLSIKNVRKSLLKREMLISVLNERCRCAKSVSQRNKENIVCTLNIRL